MGLPTGGAHVCFEVVDSTFHNSPDIVKSDSFIAIPLDAGEHVESQVLISVSGSSFLGGTARIAHSQTHLPSFMWTLGQHHLILSERPFSFVIPQYFMDRDGSLGRVG
ncbi:MAG: hypothetical protein IKK03_01015 [Lachnospiraceae bacterium]|nr:hypothetical protein [Lachnospiraceae bacterium]